MAKKKPSRATSPTDAVTGSRYLVNHAFNVTDADGEDHWITTATAHRIDALLSDEMIADKIAAGMITDTTVTTDAGATE